MDIPTVEAIIPVAIHEQDDYLCEAKQIVLHAVMREARNVYNDTIRAHCRHFYKPHVPKVIRDLPTHSERCDAWARHLFRNARSFLHQDIRDDLAVILADSFRSSPRSKINGLPKSPPFTFIRFLPLVSGHIAVEAPASPKDGYHILCPARGATWYPLKMQEELLGKRTPSFPKASLLLTFHAGWSTDLPPRLETFLKYLSSRQGIIRSAQVEAHGDKLLMRLHYLQSTSTTAPHAPASTSL